MIYQNDAPAAVSSPEFSVATCVLMIATYTRPFTGEISVGPDLLQPVITSETASGASSQDVVLMANMTSLNEAEELRRQVLGKSLTGQPESMSKSKRSAAIFQDARPEGSAEVTSGD